MNTNETRRVRVYLRKTKKVTIHYRNLRFEQRFITVKAFVPTTFLLPHDLEVEIIKKLRGEKSFVLTSVSPRLLECSPEEEVEFGTKQIEDYLKKDNLRFDKLIFTKKYLLGSATRYPLFILDMPFEKLEYWPLHNHQFTCFIIKNEDIDRFKMLFKIIFSDKEQLGNNTGELMGLVQDMYIFPGDSNPFFVTNIDNKKEIMEIINKSCKELNIKFKKRLF